MKKVRSGMWVSGRLVRVRWTTRLGWRVCGDMVRLCFCFTKRKISERFSCLDMAVGKV